MKIYEGLKKSIINGEFGPGTRLLEVELAEIMGVSRTPVREALAQLEKDRLVVLHGPRGYKVAELNNQHIEEVFGLREVLEAYAGRLATKRITNKDILKLETIVNRSERQYKKANWDALLQLNTSFHETISKASGNSILLSFLEQLNNTVLRCRTFLIQHRNLFPETISQHKSIIKVLKNRDPEAVAEVIAHHIRQTKNKILSFTTRVLA